MRTLLVAAMVGLTKALGWDDKAPSDEIVVLAPDLDTGDLELAFGDLPPLD